MQNKLMRIIFVICFLTMLGVPLITTNLKQGEISVSENRRLTAMAMLTNQDGSWNSNFTTDFETWINDNIGLRSKFVMANAVLQYKIFHVIANNTDMYLGPRDELNYATPEMLKDYQHDNLYSEDYLKLFANSMQDISDYVKKRGATFFYYQCWDKHSIYPEQFPKTVVQKPSESKTDGLVRALEQYSDVNVVSPKQKLIEAKTNYATYSVWGDPTHWTQRGAYMGYQELMDAINAAETKTSYRVLQESDYNITMEDQGKTLFGCIHKKDFEENFEIKHPNSVLTNYKLQLYGEEPSHSYRTNNCVDNNTRLLIIGDSYFNSFIVDDIAESFHEVILIWGDYLGDIKSIIDAYDADIVVIEAAERVDRSGSIIAGATNLKEKESFDE